MSQWRGQPWRKTKYTLTTYIINDRCQGITMYHVAANWLNWTHKTQHNFHCCHLSYKSNKMQFLKNLLKKPVSCESNQGLWRHAEGGLVNKRGFRLSHDSLAVREFCSRRHHDHKSVTLKSLWPKPAEDQLFACCEAVSWKASDPPAASRFVLLV